MRRYLVVAHRTLGGAHLMEHLHHLREEDPYCRFHLVVPRYHPSSGGTWDEASVEATARERLEEMLDRMAAMGMGATGDIGDADPVLAVEDTMRREGRSITGIVVSTLPTRSSAWLRGNVPQRIAKRFPFLRVDHVVAEEILT